MASQNHALQCWVVLGFLCWGLPLAKSQDESRLEALQEDVLEDLGQGSLVAPRGNDEPGDIEGGDRVLLPALRGLVLVPSQERVAQKADLTSPNEIKNLLEGAPPELGSALQAFLGEPLTLNLLAEVNRTINRVYREDDRPVVDAYLPEQDVSNGVVQLVVIEGRLGHVRTEGVERSNPDYLKKQVRIEPGEVLRESELDWDLDWLNSHPFRRVNMIFEPGEVEGTTDIVLQTTDAKPIRLHAGIDNTGLDVTGEHQWNFGATWGRVFNTEQLLSYQYSTDIEFQNLEAHSLFYRIPLPWRHRIDFIAARVTSDVDVVASGEVIGLGGESTLSAVNYVIPIRPRFFDLSRSELSLGADYKSTNNDVEFGGQSIFDETAAVFQFSVGWNGTRPDPWGATGLSFDTVWSPGNLIGDNDDRSFGTQRGGATSDYFYTELSLERLFRLPQEWSLAFSGSGQFSNSRLISTEQLLAGGYRSVRGFDENLIRGDEGFLSSFELISPPFSPSQFLSSARDDDMHLIVFTDAAWLSSVDGAADEEDTSLSSIGLELKYRWGSQWSMRAGYGWHLDTKGVDNLDHDGRLHLGATLRY